MTEAKPDRRITGPDGMIRTVEQEQALEDLALAAFSSGAASDYLAYMTNVTLHNVTGPVASDAQLRHLEGQRYLVAVIRGRIQNAERRQRESEQRRKQPQ